MGREIKRVPLDFAYGPDDGVWPGYTRDCGKSDCDGCPDCDSEEPPVGDGWQVWETVSEGSAASPVFVDRADCVAWLVAEEDAAPAAAEAFIDQGHAFSLARTPFGVFNGVQVAAGVAVAVEWLHIKNGDRTTIAAGTPIRHRETGITGKINNRLPPSNGDFYFVTWDRSLPALLAENADVYAEAPMNTLSRVDGFDVVASKGAVT